MPDLIPAVESQPAHDAHLAREPLEGRERPVSAQEIADLRRRILTLRDHAIGAEAAVGAAQAEAEAARGHMERVLTELANVKRSRTWRTGRVVVSPVDYIRRALHRR